METLVKGLLEAEEKFLSDPKDLHSLETAVKTSTDALAAGFLSNILSSVNKQIYDCSWRKGRYTVVRTDKRTLISSVGILHLTVLTIKRLKTPVSITCCRN